jgi:hypothetical protein
MGVFTFNWCRVEGAPIPDLQKEYGSFTQLPSNTKVFYGTPEVQINNPTSIVNGSVYKIVPISEFGYNSIKEIDENFSNLEEAVSNYNKTIEVQDNDNSAQYYYEPFVITESSIIFYADSTKKVFDQQTFIYVDQFATPDIVTITARYVGSPVPVGDTFDLDDIIVSAIYSDGNNAQIKEGYTVEPEDRIIKELKSNVIKIIYVSPEDVTFISNIIIEGIKNLESIEAFYDGPNVTFGQEAERKYFIVVAKYSDGSSAAVTGFSFPDGNIVSETNAGVLTIFYKGMWTTVTIPTYDVSSSRLMAYYNGPNVEINNEFDIKYANIKICYKSDDNKNIYYEDIEPGLCTFSSTTIEKEGTNHVFVQYEGKLGKVSTTMIVIGIKPDITVNFIEAEYTGPSIEQGKAFSIERVICKVHYSNGAIVTVRNFALNSNIVQYIGLNEYVVTYKEKDTTVTTTFGVIGLEKDNTSEDGYTPISLQNNYPEATRLNNRYRGPAESYKHESVDSMIFENIQTLYSIYRNIEIDFNKLVEQVNNNSCTKIKVLNSVSKLNQETINWIEDNRFTTGKYKERNAES